MVLTTTRNISHFKHQFLAFSSDWCFIYFNKSKKWFLELLLKAKEWAVLRIRRPLSPLPSSGKRQLSFGKESEKEVVNDLKICIFLYWEVGFPHKSCKMVIKDNGPLFSLTGIAIVEWNDASYNDSIGGRSWREHYRPFDFLSAGITVSMYVLELGWEESVSEICCGEIYWLFPPHHTLHLCLL